MPEDDGSLLRVVTLNGVPLAIPREELQDPHPDLAGGDCPWLDRATGAVCTISSPHADGHIAHDGYGQVIAIWDEDHGYRPPGENWRVGGKVQRHTDGVQQ